MEIIFVSWDFILINKEERRHIMGVEFYKPQKLEDVLDVLATKKAP